LEKALTELSQFVIADVTLGDILLRLSELATEVVPAATAVGISMLDDKNEPSTLIYTDNLSPTIDAMQYAENSGPCLDAWRQRRVVRVNDTSLSFDQYPGFSRAAIEMGIHSTMSLPLLARDVALGGFNMYSPERDGFSREDEARAVSLTATASIVLTNARSYWNARTLSENLDEAMRTRGVIEQAKGIVMGQMPELGPEDAFLALRALSQKENVKLREIARRVVERRSLQ